MRACPTRLRKAHENSRGFRPLFRANWERLFLINYLVDRDELQKRVPYEVDTFKGATYVSLVAVSVTKMRVVGLPECQRVLLRPFTEHEFLNVRTYVRQAEDRGIFFLTEFVNRRWAVPLGAFSFGLPYMYGEISYELDKRTRVAPGRVTQPGAIEELRFRTAPLSTEDLNDCEPNTEAEFLMERYHAYSRWLGLQRQFQIRHDPWNYVPIEIEQWSDQLIRNRFPGLLHGQFVSAYFSPGVFGVEISRPYLLN